MASARNHLGGVQFAQVAVDTETGVVRVERVVAVHDCGRPINPRQTESQIHGGILQGISYALFEERVLDRASGFMLNANLEQYKILRSRELPAIEVVILENYQGTSSTDAYGVAEPAHHPDRSRDRQRRLQRDRRAHARAADDAGERPSRARADSATGRSGMNAFEWTSPQTLAQALGTRTATMAARMLSASGQPPAGDSDPQGRRNRPAGADEGRTAHAGAGRQPRNDPRAWAGRRSNLTVRCASVRT